MVRAEEFAKPPVAGASFADFLESLPHILKASDFHAVVDAIVDSRRSPSGPLVDAARARDIPILSELRTELHAVAGAGSAHVFPDLASYERPKKVALLEDEFTIEDGTLTPTQKVKRRVVQERYRHVIDAFYEEENAGRDVFVASDFEVAGGTR